MSAEAPSYVYETSGLSLPPGTDVRFDTSASGGTAAAVYVGGTLLAGATLRVGRDGLIPDVYGDAATVYVRQLAIWPTGSVVAGVLATLTGSSTNAPVPAPGGSGADQVARDSVSTLAASLPGTYAPAGSMFENAPAVQFGHSFGASRSDLGPGPGADVDGHALERVAVRYRTKALNTSSSQANLANYAAGGTRSDQILASVQTNYPVNTRGVVFIAGGHRNDQNAYGNATPKPATVAEVFRAMFAYLTCKLVQTVAASSFASVTGSWSSGTASSGATMNFAFNGDAVFLRWSAVTGAGGTFTVPNGNGSTKTVTTGGYGNAFVGAVKLSGFGPGDHQVTITVTAGTVTIVGALIPAATPPVIVWELEPPYNPAIVTGGALANTVNTAYQTATQAVLADFDQTRIVVVDAPPTWDPAVDTCPDGVHPSAPGHRKIADQAMLRIGAKITGYIQGLNWLTGSTADPVAYVAPTATGGATDTTAPTISSFTATPANAQNSLVWSGSDNVGITRWTVVRGGTTVYDGTATSFVDTGLANGTAYSYTLTAYDAAGNTVTASASGTPASGAANFVSDSFTDTAGTLLSAHTGEVGATWTRNGGTPSGAAVITAANRIRSSAAASATFNASGAPASANQSIQADFYFGSLATATSTGLGLRVIGGGSGAYGYYLRYVVSTGVWRIDKTVNNVATTLASYTPTTAPAPGETHTAKLVVTGTTLTAFVDGALLTMVRASDSASVTSITDTEVTTAGLAAVTFTGTTALTDTTGIQLDNVVATNL